MGVHLLQYTVRTVEKICVRASAIFLTAKVYKSSFRKMLSLDHFYQYETVLWYVHTLTLASQGVAMIIELKRNTFLKKTPKGLKP